MLRRFVLLCNLTTSLGEVALDLGAPLNTALRLASHLIELQGGSHWARQSCLASSSVIAHHIEAKAVFPFSSQNKYVLSPSFDRVHMNTTSMLEFEMLFEVRLPLVLVSRIRID